jgi:putative SOS response-associated peptidase YedK
MAAIHDRMPVILPPEAFSIWLHEGSPDAADLTHLLTPFPADLMEAYEVSRLVNAPVNDRPECIEPV